MAYYNKNSVINSLSQDLFSSLRREENCYKTIYGFVAIKRDIYVPHLSMEVTCYLYSKNSKELGFYSNETKRIYINLDSFKYSRRDIYQVICHEYWHSLQAQQGYGMEGECTKGETRYYNSFKMYFNEGEYLHKNASEMGAEVFCFMLGFRYKSFPSSYSKKKLLDIFYKYVISTSPLYKEEWKRIKTKKQRPFHKALNWK